MLCKNVKQWKIINYEREQFARVMIECQKQHTDRQQKVLLKPNFMKKINQGLNLAIETLLILT